MKLKFSDFTRTTVERAGHEPSWPEYDALLAEGFARYGKHVRLIGVGVRFTDPSENETQLPLL